MPCHRWKGDFKDLLILYSVQAGTLAVSWCEQELEADADRLEDSVEQDNQQTSRFFAQASAGLHTLSIILSNLSRGAYNQSRKCTDFFEVSMSWPDRIASCIWLLPLLIQLDSEMIVWASCVVDIIIPSITEVVHHLLCSQSFDTMTEYEQFMATATLQSIGPNS